ncbi:MAG: hypothetical protein RI894_346 [Bacteroidota bacterium]|jgi:hypothetical protein
MQLFLKFLFLNCFLIATTYTYAQPTDENNGGGETSAREQLFASNWEWVAKTRQPNRGGSERYSLKPQGEQIRISFDRTGHCFITKNGATINSATYTLMEDDARIVFGKWDTPSEFHLDEGPFDFEANLLWIRGEYNDKGSTWQLAQAGTASTYSPPAQAARAAPAAATRVTPTTAASTTSATRTTTSPSPVARTGKKTSTTSSSKKKRR